MNAGGEYHSYLLRLWQEATDGHDWRILLESVRTGEKRGFTSLEELLDYLGRLTAEEFKTTGEGRQSEVQG